MAIVSHLLQICLSPSWGGLEMVAFEMAAALPAEHLDTCVVPHSKLEETLNSRGFKTRRISCGKKSYIGRALELRKILKAQKHDLILIQQLHDLWYLRLALMGVKAPLIVGISHTLLAVKKKDFLHSWLYGALDKLICFTDIHKANLLDHLPVKETQLRVIPNSVNTTKFNPGKFSSVLRSNWVSGDIEILIGLVGRLDGGKGQDILLEAALILKKQGLFKFRILLIGEDTINDQGTNCKLRDFVKAQGLEDIVTFTGFREDIPEVMASLDILVMASRAETFGRVIIEGMASGVPVVATRAGGVPDIIEDLQNGILVAPGSPEKLAEALRNLILNSEDRRKIAHEGLKKARTIYDEDIILPKIKEALFLQ